jgi:hypothetical protein
MTVDRATTGNGGSLSAHSDCMGEAGEAYSWSCAEPEAGGIQFVLHVQPLGIAVSARSQTCQGVWDPECPARLGQQLVIRPRYGDPPSHWGACMRDELGAEAAGVADDTFDRRPGRTLWRRPDPIGEPPDPLLNLAVAQRAADGHTQHDSHERDDEEALPHGARVDMPCGGAQGTFGRDLLLPSV